MSSKMIADICLWVLEYGVIGNLKKSVILGLRKVFEEKLAWSRFKRAWGCRDKE